MKIEQETYVALGEPERAPEIRDAELNLLELLIALARRKRFVFFFTVAVALAAAAVSLLLPAYYTAKSRIVPPEVRPSAAMALLGGGAAANLLGSPFGWTDPNETYVGMLRSHSIADELIRKFDLKNRYDSKTLVDARDELATRSKVEIERGGIIAVSVEDRDPVVAAQMANEYVAQMRELSRRMAEEEAGERERILEEQMGQLRDALGAAELELQKIQEKTGLIVLDEQAKSVIATIAMARAEVAAKQLEITTLRTSATEQHPEVVRAREQLAALRAQLAQLERNQEVGLGNIHIPAGRMPELGLEFLRRTRDVRYYEAVYMMLAGQLEAARVDRASVPLAIKIMDVATPPDKRSWPKRALITLLAAMAGFFVAIAIVCAVEARSRILADPARASRWALLLDLLEPRRGMPWSRSRGK